MSLDGGATPMTAATSEAPGWQHLLMTWLSPAFPVGAFAYSHGLEMAAERGLVRMRGDLESWIGALVSQGSLHNDLLLMAAAHRAVSDGDRAALAGVNELAVALQPSAERWLETTQQGGSFLLAVTAAWPHPSLATLRDAMSGDTTKGEIAYPVALAMAAASHDIPVRPTLEAYAFAFASMLTSAAIRLGVVGQTDAQRVMAALALPLRAAAMAAAIGTLDDIGSATPSSDLCSMEHETQYSRLFRS